MGNSRFQKASFSDSLPVYVFIHGGGLLGGSSQVFDGIFDNLVNRGPLILVSISYRLGSFGEFPVESKSQGSSQRVIPRLPETPD